MMTPEQRTKALDDIFKSLDGKNIEKIRKICSILHCEENTVRIWRMSGTHRVIPEQKVRILQDALK